MAGKDDSNFRDNVDEAPSSIPDGSEAVSSDEDTESDGSISPFVRRHIRRSLRRLKYSSDEEDEPSGSQKKDEEEQKKKASSRRMGHQQETLAMDAMTDLDASVLAIPAEDDLAQDPRGLKSSIKLMPHQKYALTWLLWRESQIPAGGVLADDMGLGKTLEIISLILAGNERRDDGSDDEERSLSSARTERNLGGTLVVAPASLLAQWESEVTKLCKEGSLEFDRYHGTNRETTPKLLARNDLVITTYQILARAFKSPDTLFKIHWKRVILDEAHVIRNHNSQTCKAVCRLIAEKRWAITGTPVQNKEMDLFSLLKFLKCSPFDEVHVWKRWLVEGSSHGSERLAGVMKSIMLRRTKREVQALPGKSVEAIEVTLDPEEREVYREILHQSRTLLSQFLGQQDQKAHTAELGAQKYDQPSTSSSSYTDTQFRTAQKKLLFLPLFRHAGVPYHLLVLILRLRQLCCHAALIESMLDGEDIEANGLEGVEVPIQLATRLNKMSLREDDDEDADEIGVHNRVFERLLTSGNPVLDPKRPSSKMKAILEKIEEIVENREDKVIVASQWTAVLDIMAEYLEQMENVSYRMYARKVTINDRQGIVEDFNSPNSRTNVLLLSLTAGGVGLNLVGANHLILMDVHWNPQLESQAQNRILRFSQKKNVRVYKYFCVDTIEQRIIDLQEQKLEMATSLLSGTTTELSLDELSLLIGV